MNPLLSVSSVVRARHGGCFPAASINEWLAREKMVNNDEDPHQSDE